MKQRQRHQRQGKPQRITKAVTHIRLIEVNPGKFAALDQLAPVYLALCQQYVTFFCAQAQPDRFHSPIKSAYSSQECSVCHYVDRANRPDQQTFCCGVCGYEAHADLNSSINIARRLRDVELQACRGRQAVKALLMRRHHEWKIQHGWP